MFYRSFPNLLGTVSKVPKTSVFDTQRKSLAHPLMEVFKTEIESKHMLGTAFGLLQDKPNLIIIIPNGKVF
jgi:hypothetical protein